MTQSLEDYLETIFVLIGEGRPAQVRDVARLLDVKMPSVVKAIHELKKFGLVTQEPYSPINLTTKGERVARIVLNRHKLLRSFLMKLGVSRRIADKDACLMEHILSAETIDKIRAYTEKTNEKPDKHNEAAPGARPHTR
ncbi:MAG: metal-dependent transcriptional regulator [Kiritimatiellae bacterium]|nr:metal-dependent transcriptional regulator [Kiritimatiellia bacterium]